MIAHQWTANRVPVDLYKPKKTMSFARYDFCQAISSYHSPRTCEPGGGYHCAGTFKVDRGLGLAEDDHEVRAETANSGAETASFANRTGHAGQREQ